jgi:hypothetical protein
MSQKQFPFNVGARVLCVDPENVRYHQSGRVESIFGFRTTEYGWVRWEDTGGCALYSADGYCPLEEHP